MSAGESDIETDRVSCLHTTALGFAPFIFDLNENVGFIQLMDICQSVWKEIEENETLPEKLVMCKKCSYERKKYLKSRKLILYYILTVPINYSFRNKQINLFATVLLHLLYKTLLRFLRLL